MVYIGKLYWESYVNCVDGTTQKFHLNKDQNPHPSELEAFKECYAEKSEEASEANPESEEPADPDSDDSSVSDVSDVSDDESEDSPDTDGSANEQGPNESESPEATERPRLKPYDIKGDLALYTRYVNEIKEFGSFDVLKNKKTETWKRVREELGKIKPGEFQKNSLAIGLVKKTIEDLEKHQTNTKPWKARKDVKYLKNKLKILENHTQGGSPPEMFGSRGFWPAFVSGTAVVVMSAVLAAAGAV
jgi:hypothetical protein